MMQSGLLARVLVAGQAGLSVANYRDKYQKPINNNHAVLQMAGYRSRIDIITQLHFFASLGLTPTCFCVQ
jgi:hypothetical protein